MHQAGQAVLQSRDVVIQAEEIGRLIGAAGKKAPVSAAAPRPGASLREIAAGLVTFREDVRNTVIEFIVERRKAGFM